MCGGTTNDSIATNDRNGLSPRVRGNHTKTAKRVNPARSIPACAGEPHSEERVVVNHRVYPRVCGGTHSEERVVVNHQGLSPRVRGNQR